MTKTVFLYGDSIIWGLNGQVGARHERADRVDTIVQKLLGDDVEVIAEGLRGRTMFGENGFFPKRDGLAQFGPILASHLPVDVIFIMLGVNDLNTKTRHDPADIAAALDAYEDETRFWCEFMKLPMPKFCVISPTPIDENGFSELQQNIFGDAGNGIRAITEQLRLKAEQKDWSFLEGTSIAQPINTDGIHLDGEQSKKLGQAIAAEASRLVS